MMKVLVADPLSAEGISILKETEGIEVDLKPGMKQEELIACIPEYDALIVRSETKVTAEVIQAAKKLRIIGRAGVGVDNIDVVEATKKGIIVMNTPEGNTISTAEHTMALLLALARHIPQAHASLKSRVWDRKRFIGTEIHGKTLGIIGLGRIGTAVAKRAEGFGMRILAYDPFISPKKAASLEINLVDLDTLYSQSDFITIHTPLSPQTRHLIGREEFGKMKQGVRIINCARGGIIDEEALYDAIKSGKVCGAALDVFEKEPPFDSPLLDLPEVIAVPHLGASTHEAQLNVGIEIANQIVDALKNNLIRNAVNIPQIDKDVALALSPYIGLCEKIGCFQAQLIKGMTEEIKVEYSGEITAYNLSPLTTAVLKGMLSTVLSDVVVNYVNAILIAQERGLKVVEAKSSESQDYLNLISVSVKTEKETRTVKGTLLWNNDPRIVGIDEFRVDAVPEGYLLVISQTDEPGIIGRVGTILGKEGINIGWMQLSRTGVGKKALSVWNVDCEVKERTVQEIGEAKEILEVKLIKL